MCEGGCVCVRGGDVCVGGVCVCVCVCRRGMCVCVCAPADQTVPRTLVGGGALQVLAGADEHPP